MKREHKAHNIDPGNIVSIVVATYNSENYLEECIKSILNQTYKNYELIIIDGGSRDNTLKIIKKYEKHISRWLSEPDNGVYDAWNKAIKLAMGDWICFVGSDDLLYENYLEEYTKQIQGHNLLGKVDFISSYIDLVEDNLTFIKTVGEAWQWALFKKNMTTWHLGSLHSRKLFETYGSFDTKFRISGDYEFLLRPKDKLKTSFVSKSLAMMRNTGISSSQLIPASVETYRAKIKNGIMSPVKGYIFTAIDIIRLKLRFILKRIFF